MSDDYNTPLGKKIKSKLAEVDVDLPIDGFKNIQKRLRAKKRKRRAFAYLFFMALVVSTLFLFEIDITDNYNFREKTGSEHSITEDLTPPSFINSKNDDADKLATKSDNEGEPPQQRYASAKKVEDHMEVEQIREQVAENSASFHEDSNLDLEVHSKKPNEPSITPKKSDLINKSAQNLGEDLYPALQKIQPLTLKSISSFKVVQLDTTVHAGLSSVETPMTLDSAVTFSWEYGLMPSLSYYHLIPKLDDDIHFYYLDDRESNFRFGLLLNGRWRIKQRAHMGIHFAYDYGATSLVVRNLENSPGNLVILESNEGGSPLFYEGYEHREIVVAEKTHRLGVGTNLAHEIVKRDNTTIDATFGGTFLFLLKPSTRVLLPSAEWSMNFSLGWHYHLKNSVQLGIQPGLSYSVGLGNVSNALAVNRLQLELGITLRHFKKSE